MKRFRYIFKGLVQGVGFRPFIYRLAKDLSLSGFVKNVGFGVVAEFQGDIDDSLLIDEYIKNYHPKHAKIELIEKIEIDVLDDKSEFFILKSESDIINTTVPFDLGICKNCIEEFYDEKNRHHLNFFISCTDCGPRYTMIKSLPYDRENTAMAEFKFCAECEKEYYNFYDRRFNAQSTTCQACGPSFFLYSIEEKKLIDGENKDLMDIVCKEILNGKIVAIKGIGGFHLVADPDNDRTVERLFISKRRDKKPIALVCSDVKAIEKYCIVSAKEKEFFLSSRSPIVLFKLKTDKFLNINDGLSTLGVMHAYTPVLHYILAKTKKEFLIATSANLSGLPMITDNDQAKEKLKGVADYVLYHNRDIIRRCDDSVGFCVKDKFILTRAGRGFAPITFKLNQNIDDINIIGLGAHEKTSICIKKGNEIIMSQYLGDLDTKEYIDSYLEELTKFIELYQFEFDYIACDHHKEYYTSILANQLSEKYNKKIIYTQHHVCHIFSVMLENMIDSCIGFAFDGTGLGLDGKIWGSEGFVIDGDDIKREFHLDYFPLISGEKAIKEPSRLAYYLAKKIDAQFAEEFFKNDKRMEMIAQSTKGIKYPLTSSMGRLFDVVAVLLGCGHKNAYESQLPMRLESIAKEDEEGFYDVFMKINHEIVVDVVDILQPIIYDIKRGIDFGVISAKFHNTISKIVVEVAKLLRENYNKNVVVLSGGVFQNKFLLKKTVYLLEKEGFKVYFNSIFPVNDSGISAGQVYYTIKMLKKY